MKFISLKKNEFIGNLRDKIDLIFNFLSYFLDVKLYLRNVWFKYFLGLNGSCMGREVFCLLNVI